MTEAGEVTDVDGPDTQQIDESRSDSEQAAESTSGSGPAVTRETIVSYLQWGALFAFALLAVIAGVGLYTSLGAIIDVWVADRYQPFARVGLNFAVLCVAVGGIVAIVRRL